MIFANSPQITIIALLCLIPPFSASHTAEGLSFERSQGSVAIRAKGKPLATYVFEYAKQNGEKHSKHDRPIQRPYFKDVHAPGGIRVTRNCPPLPDKDPVDHATMHPGLWLAFGDIGGADVWRNRAEVEHIAFVHEPESADGKSGFTVRNRYKNGDRIICEEVCQYTFVVKPNGYLIFWDSAFQSDVADFHFGDQEEMGLGIRVATPIMVKSFKGVKTSGRILNDRGETGEKGTWGKEALWCDYSGWMGKTFVGFLVIPNPKNVRPCRWHTRSYGFMAANPFGCKVFRAGPARKTVVKKGESFRLGFGIFIHAGEKEDSVDLRAAYQDYLGRVKAE